MPNPYCPFAVQAILYPEANNEPRIVPRAAVAHRHGSPGSSANVGKWFDREDVHTESHFSIARNGTIYQFMPVNRQSDAQHAGNGYTIGGVFYGCVSIESEDDGDWEAIWTWEQVQGFIRLLKWLRDEWSIPARLTESWSDAGMGWHRRHREWNRNGHYCVSDVQVGQFIRDILPALQAPATPVPNSDEGRDDMKRGDKGPAVVAWITQLPALAKAVNADISGLDLSGDKAAKTFGGATEAATNRVRKALRLAESGTADATIGVALALKVSVPAAHFHDQYIERGSTVRVS